MLDVIERRRSIRQFTEEDIPSEQVTTLLAAAMSAPSGRHADPWQFVVVRDRDMRAELSRVHRFSGMAAFAPVVVVVCGDESLSEQWVSDCSAATQNMLLQTVEMGLGAVWVAIYPHPDREERVRELLAIPSGQRVLCLIPVGHPAEQKAPRSRYDGAKVHYERFRQ